MNLKLYTKSLSQPKFDPLSMYHHLSSFDPKLRNLLSILESQKEYKLEERFKKIESTLDLTFRLELIHHLNLKNSVSVNFENESEHHYSHPQILLHFWCLLECTDSLEYIANYLELNI